MIPKRLVLRNFLSYREATLDFEGLHVACVAGANGAGKSSLLEAIAWALWGESRTVAEDDVVHLGEQEAQVSFSFEHQQQVYRVVRSRRRKQGGMLEFQVQTAQGFRPLTQRGMRATQLLINQTLRLDYETFVNAAYLRQGRADEFMLKRPSERKQILADLLKLGQYDELAERAKERAREAKAEVTVLEEAIARLQTEVSERSAIAHQVAALEEQLASLQAAQEADQHILTAYEQQQQTRQRLTQDLQWVQHQRQHGQREHDRLWATEQALCQELEQVAAVLARAAEISAGMATLQALEQEEEQMAAQAQAQQTLQAERDRCYQAHQAEVQALQWQLQQQKIQLTTLDDHLAELHPLLQKREQVAQAVADLTQARDRLKALDALHLQVVPLQKQRQTLEQQLAQSQADLTARLRAIADSHRQLMAQQATYPQLQAAVQLVGQTLESLAAKRTYQEKVREKGVERRNFMERLQAQQRSYEEQMAQIQHKLELLQQPNASCPVCDRPLEQHNWEMVLAKHRQEQEELQKEIWAIREQLAVSEREIQVLRQEYRDLEEALTDYGRALEQRGHLLAQLGTCEQVSQQLQSLALERSHLERCLAENVFATDIRAELQQVEAQLAQLGYDERDHALVRGQVDQLRWAEVRQAEIRQAEMKAAQLQEQRPQLLAAIANLEAAIADLAHSPTVQTLVALDAQIADLGYSLEAHQQLRHRLKASQGWALQHQTLKTAQQAQPQLEAQRQEMQQQREALEAQLALWQTQEEQLTQQLTNLPDCQADLEQVQQRMGDRQRQRESLLAQFGALQQQLTQLDQRQTELTQHQQTLQQVQRRLRVHQELATAFGKSGLQTLLIEHLLPQLEAETNHLLGRLSAYQLHVQFVTQRASRSRHSKPIDTLDILIADTQGTRPYETYSGGEAFRVNFAIRLAIARLLAQRSGTPLQMLIIDEGFGTQDREGCERLIGAINAISADFACILAVTHIPHFREAFETRIDVIKTAQGSELTLSL